MTLRCSWDGTWSGLALRAKPSWFNHIFTGGWLHSPSDVPSTLGRSSGLHFSGSSLALRSTFLRVLIWLAQMVLFLFCPVGLQGRVLHAQASLHKAFCILLLLVSGDRGRQIKAEYKTFLFVKRSSATFAHRLQIPAAGSAHTASFPRLLLNP